MLTCCAFGHTERLQLCESSTMLGQAFSDATESSMLPPVMPTNALVYRVVLWWCELTCHELPIQGEEMLLGVSPGVVSHHANDAWTV